MAFEWVGEEEAKTALSDVRNKQSETNWAVFGYEGDKIKLIAPGTGGVDDFLPHLIEDGIRYVVYGVHVKDQDETGFGAEKFIFITWVGTKCKPMVKAKSSQHRRPLYQYILKYLQLQAELQVLEPGELSEALVLEKIRGTRVEADNTRASSASSSSSSSAAASSPAVSHSPAASPATRSPAERKPAASGGGGGGSAVLEFVDQADANAKLEDVRNDKTDTNWVVYGHEGAKLKVLGSGSGGLDEMQVHFGDDDIVYGVIALKVRDEDGGSEYSTTKYVFISWVGPSVKPMVKARSSQVRVALYRHAKGFLQLAAEIQALERSDITHQKLLDKLNSVF